MAMFCLQCVMLTPFDSLLAATATIDRTIDVYADDITIAVVGSLSNIVNWAAKVLRLLVQALDVLELPPAKHKMTVTSSVPSGAKRVCSKVKSLGVCI